MATDAEACIAWCDMRGTYFDVYFDTRGMLDYYVDSSNTSGPWTGSPYNPFLKIQDGIDASQDGDKVLVESGVYYENIDFSGKAITVTSLNAATITTIDGLQSGPVVSFVNNEGPDSVLQGFTLTNGTIGIKTTYSAPTIEDNIITGNINSSEGGGINCYGNTTDSPLIIGNVILSNSANIGAGIFVNHCSPLIENNVIAKNSSTMGGGGIRCKWRAEPIITNNTIYGNVSGTGGGGIITDGWYSIANIKNCVIWGNDAPAGKQIYLQANGNGPSTVNISYSDVEGGKSGVYVQSGCTLNWSDEMIDQDPLVVNHVGNDFHLTRESPCINRGTNTGAPLTDMDGDSRPTMGLVDMGADEFTGTHYLSADTFTLSGSGGEVNFDIAAGAGNAGRYYLLFCSYSGNAPGTPFPGGHITVPVNWDDFTQLGINLMNTPYFHQFMGPVDFLGEATAKLWFPDAASGVGLNLTFAYGMNNPWNVTSNPVGVEIVP